MRFTLERVLGTLKRLFRDFTAASSGARWICSDSFYNHSDAAYAKSRMAHPRASLREQEPRVQAAEAAAPRVMAPGDFGHLDMLKAISPAHRRSIFAACITRQCKRGATILNQGDRGDFVAFVAQG
jgi:hypothetical protein